MSSGVLLRGHLDNLLKLYAFTIIDDKGGFLNKVMSGKQILQMKLENGQQLHESFLHEDISKEYPWVSVVYGKKSGFIHFSNAHIVACHSFNGPADNKKITMLFEKESKITDKFRIEAIECIVDITNCIIKIIEKALLI